MMNIKNNLLSALPVFLLGCGITAACFIANGPCDEIPTWRLYSGIAVGALAAVFIACISIIGLTKKIPDWSVTWLSVFIAGLFISLNFKLDSGILRVFRVVLLVITIFLTLWVLGVIVSRPWHVSGLLGMGLSAVLSILLFFIATNISHDAIKLGYYAAPIGLFISALIFIFNTMHKYKIVLILIVMIVNGGLIYAFDTAMQRFNMGSQLMYLLILSVGILFSGMIVRQVITWIKNSKNTEETC